MSVCYSGRCKRCNSFFQNITVYDRRKFEEEGFTCSTCSLMGNFDDLSALKKKISEITLVDETIENRFDILDL